MKNKIAFLILAAGNSSRMGFPKQLLRLGNEDSLLSKAISIGEKIKEIDTFVVLGAHYDEILNKTIKSDATIIFNNNWQSGISSSISAGIMAIKKNKYEGVIISLVDQPFLNSQTIKNILLKVNGIENQIIISKYRMGSGPPAYFHKSYFPHLLELKGDVGAKPIVKKFRDFVDHVIFTDGNVDLDTREDLKELDLPNQYF